jgi:hypothetical protein
MESEKVTSTLHNIFLRYVIVASIVLLCNLFIFQSLELAWPSPRYENFCTAEMTAKSFESEDSCREAGGKWSPAPGTNPGYCDATATCQKMFDTASKEYSGKAFVVLLVAGVVLLIAGVSLPGSSVVTNGLSAAGVISILLGALMHWSYMYPLLKIFLLGALLAGVIFLAWKKFKD